MTVTPTRSLDVVVVGAGFAGLYMVHRARGLGLDVQGIEAGDGVGGTWFWNRYPGARCDVESLEYSYSFDEGLEQEWEWTERYATQPEILRYIDHVADRFDLRRSFRFGTRVVTTTWSEADRRWSVTTDRGPERPGERSEPGAGSTGDAYEARFVVMATGCLSVPVRPDIAGLDTFVGRTLWTSTWPAEGVDLTGLRVGVVGTGSSAVQSIPLIAEQAAALTVFQRTATYAVPAHNRPLGPDEQAEVKARYRDLRAANLQMSIGAGSRVPRIDDAALAVDDATRDERLEQAWDWGGLPFLGAFNDLLLDPAANEVAAEFVRDKIREQVSDPEVVERLTPRQVIGCKRLCVDTGYYVTFERPNVRLVDVGAEPIHEVTPTGVRFGDEEVELDVLVLATGFDAMTGALDRIAITGRDGLTLADAWAEGPHTYLGLMVHGFPNLFTVTGPGSPSVLANMVVAIEHHVGWISDTLAHLDATGAAVIEADVAAQDEWVSYVNAVADLTLFPTCGSWYLGANVPGKPRVFMPLPGFPLYAEQVADVVADDYRGFAVT